MASMIEVIIGMFLCCQVYGFMHHDVLCRVKSSDDVVHIRIPAGGISTELYHHAVLPARRYHCLSKSFR